jgi:hypothetical protein
MLIYIYELGGLKKMDPIDDGDDDDDVHGLVLEQTLLLAVAVIFLFEAISMMRCAFCVTNKKCALGLFFDEWRLWHVECPH